MDKLCIDLNDLLLANCLYKFVLNYTYVQIFRSLERFRFSFATTNSDTFIMLGKWWKWAIIMIAVAIIAILDCDPLLYFLPSAPETEQQYADKVVWIIGASSGIGAALAADFTRAGARVVVSARRKAKLDQVVEDCRGLGKYVPTAMELDVTDYKAQQNVYDNIKKWSGGKIDVLVPLL